MTATYRLWNKLAGRPGGTRAFSALVSLKAPYFATVLPHVVELVPGRCVVRAPKWWAVQNHIKTFHAIASLNVAEMAMGMLAEATVPPTHRWLPKAMHTQYLAKSSGGLTATAELPSIPDFATIDRGVDVVVPVRLVDATGTHVAQADITIWVSPRPSR